MLHDVQNDAIYSDIMETIGKAENKQTGGRLSLVDLMASLASGQTRSVIKYLYYRHTVFALIYLIIGMPIFYFALIHEINSHSNHLSEQVLLFPAIMSLAHTTNFFPGSIT